MPRALSQSRRDSTGVRQSGARPRRNAPLAEMKRRLSSVSPRNPPVRFRTKPAVQNARGISYSTDLRTLRPGREQRASSVLRPSSNQTANTVIAGRGASRTQRRKVKIARPAAEAD